MKMKIYSIYDDKAEIYNRPWFQVNEATARRTCQDLLGRQDTEFGNHPEDFVLFELGEYDDQTGMIEYSARVIGRLIEMRRVGEEAIEGMKDMLGMQVPTLNNEEVVQ